ncbi:ABC-type transporter, integral membrane subunit [Hippea maritima DSM 10411]|uniref:ABC-type transporter, integral membrane subunit n=1 Tax=Hippea maritima (strain ATCC 700847 / DSM 10411 / MH2) TaxID=760142 RepID=F2LVC8_HIPMA|nr:ABC-type transporter, integral membrane subunit [Hippea maritima DSM 10411]
MLFYKISPDTFIVLELFILLSIFLNLILKKNKECINISTTVLIVILFLYSGGSYAKEVFLSNHIARISFASGFWISLFFIYVIVIDSLKNTKPVYKIGVVLLFLLVFTFFTVGGFLDKIDIMREFYVRKSRFISEISTHMYLSFASVLAASIISFPLGVLAYKKRKTTQKIFAILNIFQTIPSIAMFGALILPLAYLSKHSRVLSSMGISGIGFAPAFIALVVYAMLPLVRNIYSGLRNVPEDAKQASMGMGMNGIQLLFMVEIPLAIVEILTGLKISLVQTIGNAALAALIGAGGLGVFIFQGLGEASSSLIMLGVLPLVFIAITAEYIMNVIIMFASKRMNGYD